MSSRITPEHTKAGGRSAATAKANVLPASNALKSPFDVLRPDFKREEPLKTERTLTRHGTVRVEFPRDWHKKNGRKGAEETRASAESGAPRFKLGDYQLDVEVAERLNTLPSHRHGFK